MILQLNTTGVVDTNSIVSEDTRESIVDWITKMFPRGSIVTLEIAVSATDEPRREVCNFITPDPDDKWKYPCNHLKDRFGICPNLERHARVEHEFLEKQERELVEAGE